MTSTVLPVKSRAEALSRLLTGKTVLVIAHRMRAVAAAGPTVALQGGKGAQQGTPKEVEAQGGVYPRVG